MTRPPRTVTRRGLLAVAGAGALSAGLAGCSVNNPFADEETPAEQAVPDLSPDVAVAVEAVSAIRVAQALVEASARRHPRLSASLQGLVDMHEAHLAALVDAVPEHVDTSASAEPPAVQARPAAALRTVLADERRLQRTLTGFAMRAQSGAFARLLGSAAASVSQHVAVLG